MTVKETEPVRATSPASASRPPYTTPFWKIQKAAQATIMSQTRQTIIRWQPLPDIPETSCADFRLESFEDRRLELTIRYSWIAGNGNRDLKLGFSDVLAFRTHWDGDSPSAGKLIDPPRCTSGPAFTWPLLIVENSEWLSSGDFTTSNFIASQGHEPWTQYSVVSLERGADILARGIITADWIAGAIQQP
jgi:hypothetical protein